MIAILNSCPIWIKVLHYPKQVNITDIIINIFWVKISSVKKAGLNKIKLIAYIKPPIRIYNILCNTISCLWSFRANITFLELLIPSSLSSTTLLTVFTYWMILVLRFAMRLSGFIVFKTVKLFASIFILVPSIIEYKNVSLKVAGDLLYISAIETLLLLFIIVLRFNVIWLLELLTSFDSFLTSFFSYKNLINDV